MENLNMSEHRESNVIDFHERKKEIQESREDKFAKVREKIQRLELERAQVDEKFQNSQALDIKKDEETTEPTWQLLDQLKEIEGLIEKGSALMSQKDIKDKELQNFLAHELKEKSA